MIKSKQSKSSQQSKLSKQNNYIRDSIKDSLRVSPIPREHACEPHEWYNYSEEKKEVPNTCEHRWHLVKAIDNYFANVINATFLCDICGKVKRVEGNYP